ncbi:MAG: DAK2 domain-containing protein [Lachnospiraceae bacterium]|nr:DAK2 domain-containing protein [Lachnospiraceae bacterium]
METTSINAELLAKMFLAGAKNLDAKKEWINELNVFPVPDGDTGTNMSATIMSAAKEVMALENPDMKSLSKAMSSGSLRGARGNSGVILSQLFRGFTKAIKEYDEVDVELLAVACEKAVETAYKAVMKPKEGTILTVAKGVSVKARELATETTDVVYFANCLVAEADRVLALTPEMLPVLKQAGVVDSGGQGLVQVLKGGLAVLEGKELDFSIEEEKEEVYEYEYNVSFTVVPKKDLSGADVSKINNLFAELGNINNCDTKNNVIALDMDTDELGEVISKAMVYGSLVEIKAENKKTDAKTVVKEEERANLEPEKEYGFVAVSIGEGLAEIFKGLGADYLIEGGQTMNPSTEDVLNAISKVNAKNIFVFPNNKNIVLAANQAADLTEDKNIIVVPTKTIPQGISALINFIPEQSPEENKERMMEEISLIKTGQVTYAVRDTEIDDKVIHSGDYMGIGDSSILSVNKDINVAIDEMVKAMVDDDASMVSIYYGSDVTEDDANAVCDKLVKDYPDLEFEVNFGGQPVYYYILSVE